MARNVDLYHGTSGEAWSQIRRSKKIRGPVFLTPNIDAARDYAYEDDEGVVLTVRVPRGSLEYDYDTANPDDYDDMEEWLDAGLSVYTKKGVPLSRVVEVETEED